MLSYPISSIFLALVMMFAVANMAGGLIARIGFPLPPSNRIGCVDGLRGYLALSVLAHHFIIWLQIQRLNGTWSPPTFHFFNQLGTGGVALFFMATGLVFYPRVLQGWAACRWVSIYTGRVFRLTPLIAFSVALITVIIMVRTGNGFDGRYPLDALQWLTASGEPPLLGYAGAGRLNAFVLWSLKYEWIFYLAVLPVCAWAMDWVRKMEWPSWVVPVGLLCCAVVFFGLIRLGTYRDLPATMVDLPRYLPCFVIGMLAYECQRRPALSRWLRSKVAAAIALIGVIGSMFAFHSPYGYALPAFGFFFVCVACGNGFGGVLRLRGALVLGECSYGIYLMHGIALSMLYTEFHALPDRMPTAWLPFLMPLVGLAVLLFAALTYRMIERPAIKFGSRVAKKLEAAGA